MRLVLSNRKFFYALSYFIFLFVFSQSFTNAQSLRSFYDNQRGAAYFYNINNTTNKPEKSFNFNSVQIFDLTFFDSRKKEFNYEVVSRFLLSELFALAIANPSDNEIYFTSWFEYSQSLNLFAFDNRVISFGFNIDVQTLNLPSFNEGQSYSPKLDVVNVPLGPYLKVDYLINEHFGLRARAAACFPLIAGVPKDKGSAKVSYQIKTSLQFFTKFGMFVQTNFWLIPEIKYTPSENLQSYNQIGRKQSVSRLELCIGGYIF